MSKPKFRIAPPLCRHTAIPPLLGRLCAPPCAPTPVLSSHSKKVIFLKCDSVHCIQMLEICEWFPIIPPIKSKPLHTIFPPGLWLDSVSPLTSALIHASAMPKLLQQLNETWFCSVSLTIFWTYYFSFVARFVCLLPRAEVLTLNMYQNHLLDTPRMLDPHAETLILYMGWD